MVCYALFYPRPISLLLLLHASALLLRTGRAPLWGSLPLLLLRPATQEHSKEPGTGKLTGPGATGGGLLQHRAQVSSKLPTVA